MDDDKTKRVIGPQASINRANLSEKEQVLYDWFTEKIAGDEGDAIFYSSMLQGVACIYPNVRYWDAVAIAMRVDGERGAKERRQAATAQAEIDLKKPTEA